MGFIKALDMGTPKLASLSAPRNTALGLRCEAGVMIQATQTSIIMAEWELKFVTGGIALKAFWWRGIKISTLNERLRRGWGQERAVSEPLQSKYSNNKIKL